MLSTEMNIRVVPHCKHFPESDPVTPHVSLRAELEARQTLRSIPVDGEVIGTPFGLVIVRVLQLFPGQAKVRDFDLIVGDKQDIPCR